MFKAIKVVKNQKSLWTNFASIYQFGQIKTFILPDLGEKIKEATVKEWHVQVGDKVEEFQTIADVSTDKLFTQIPSSYNGTIKKIYYATEEIALIGEPFVDIEIDGDLPEEEASPSSQQQQQSEQKTEEKKAPAKISGKAAPRKGDERALAAPATRALAKKLNVDIDLVPGTGPEGRVTNQDVENFLSEGKVQDSRMESQLTPATRALVAEHNIDINLIQGTGKAGLVTKSDILKFLKENEGAQKAAPVAQKVGEQSTFDLQNVKMTNFGQGMQKSMTASNEIPHLYIKEEIDLTEANKFRQVLKSQGHKITFMTIFVKAFSLALLDFPIINSIYDVSKPFEYNIVQNHNITIAIASPHGLVVPNLKNVQNLNLLEIQDGINDLRVKADKGQLGPKELFEGSVSISNIGTVGGTYANPLIFGPQTSIVAIGRMQELPRYVNKQLEPRKIVNVSLGCDHRVIDGANAAGFIMKWKEYLENPSSMLLRMR